MKKVPVKIQANLPDEGRFWLAEASFLTRKRLAYTPTF